MASTETRKDLVEKHKAIRDQLEVLNQLGEKAAEIHRQAILVMTETNSVEVICSNLRNELLQTDNNVVEKLDRG